ncbi:uncharacterized protein LOC129590429 [Paramacrobiotus metropolitanus]|uniref:uncharacterized protein LOC129590429 n=1 Tax=Paramacrobiotus metropolitanus TaxID=2943436 RepID=UPI0024464E1A|nr:uncharacterized protein LOC129590429 [Paramacrobiotus metropolitanus]
MMADIGTVAILTLILATHRCCDACSKTTTLAPTTKQLPRTTPIPEKYRMITQPPNIPTKCLRCSSRYDSHDLNKDLDPSCPTGQRFRDLQKQPNWQTQLESTLNQPTSNVDVCFKDDTMCVMALMVQDRQIGENMIKEKSIRRSCSYVMTGYTHRLRVDVYKQLAEKKIQIACVDPPNKDRPYDVAWCFCMAPNLYCNTYTWAELNVSKWPVVNPPVRPSPGDRTPTNDDEGDHEPMNVQELLEMENETLPSIDHGGVDRKDSSVHPSVFVIVVIWTYQS